MINMDHLLDMAGNALLAAVGGFLSYVLRDQGTGGWKGHLFACLGAAFSGVLAAKLSAFSGLDENLTFVIVGVAGWLGAANTLNLIERIIAERVGMRKRGTSDGE